MYADRVQEVLDYLTDHPISVQSERMFYQPTSELDSSRLPDVIEGLKAEDVMLEQAKIQGRINAKPVDKMQEHSADVTVAMLYFVCQGMDEAHNIVLPYSWPQESHMGGPPVKNSPAIKESEYCHALIHRKEGDILGELGMVGFSNCKFWFGKTGYHPLYDTVKIEALKQAESIEHPIIKNFVSQAQNQTWDPETFSDVCAKALETKDEKLMNYCNSVSAFEWKLLLDHCNLKTNPNSL